ncbi:hypothetical protein Tsubulata_026335 [Turnera subulata]|uniref:Histone deacetylase interacting domain-containing protein n=1 Tax=Turnera subulata TaxID=218843 RepID=A0A9Q0F657_9ROSI|nr:hypothetical protein Tsubulata_026335 [Turnera subulata]
MLKKRARDLMGDGGGVVLRCSTSGGDNLFATANQMMSKKMRGASVTAAKEAGLLAAGFEEAIGFFNRVKVSCDRHVYEALLGTLSLYRQRCIGKDILCAKVLLLLKNHQDLTQHFLNFICGPPVTLTPPPPPPSSSGRGESRSKKVEEEKKKEKEKNHSLDVVIRGPQVTPPSPSSSDSCDHEGRSNGVPSLLQYMRKSKSKEEEKNHSNKRAKIVTDTPKQGAENVRAIQVIPERVVYANCPDLIEEVTTFATVPEDATQIAEYETLYSHTLKMANGGAIQADWAGSDHQYSAGTEENKVAANAMFQQESPVSNNEEEEEEAGALIREELKKQGICLFQKAREKLPSPQKFLEPFYYYTNGKIEKAEFDEKMAAVIGEYPDLAIQLELYLSKLDEFCGSLKDKDDNDTCKARQSSMQQKKNNQVLDQFPDDESRHCTPSYWLRTEDNDNSSSGHWKDQDTRRGEELINDKWVCQPPYSYTSTHPHKSKKEKLLLECEDDMFEVDMLLGWVKSAQDYGTGWLNSINGSKGNIMSDGKERYLINCIKRLYGTAHGQRILRSLKERPEDTLPSILSRLKQKHQELLMFRSDKRSIWADVYSKYNSRSIAAALG